MARVAFATLGCRLNQVDTQEMQGRLEARGLCTVGADEDAEVVVVNTCTVTAGADVSNRQMIRRLARRNPGARVVVTGCWAQTDAEVVRALAGVDLVVGNADKDGLPELIERLLESGPAPPGSPAGSADVVVSDIAGVRMGAAVIPGRRRGRSRAFVKIQDGCQHRCAFCIVPRARGASRSRDPKVVLDQVRLLVEAGHPEVVLTGVDLGHYGADLVPRTSLATLLAAMVQIPGLRWVRLSSLLPAYFTPGLTEIVTGSDVVAPHLHLPLQSGSDGVLRRMRRPYTAAMYRRLVERLVTARPGLGLGADVIVGHPGESDEDFAATTALVEALPFSYLHVFAYSDRAGTEAARMPDRVGAGEIRRRSQVVRELGAAKSLAFRRSLSGRVEEALVLESRDRSGRLVGLTGNYVEVQFEGRDDLMRRLVRLRVSTVHGDATLGEIA